MNELLAKLSSYHIFNYLVPGGLFVIAAKRLGIGNIDDSDRVAKLLTYYIVGLILSRVGSLIIEPLMKKAKVIAYAPYRDYVAASAKDVKIEALVEVSNTYRTLSAALLVLFAGEVMTPHNWSTRAPWFATLLALALSVMFLFSFAKQSSYVRQRVEALVGK